MTFDWTTVAVVAGFVGVLVELQSWRRDLAKQLHALDPEVIQARRMAEFEKQRQNLVELYQLPEIKKNPFINGWDSLTDEEAWRWKHYHAHLKALMREYGRFPVEFEEDGP